MANMVDDSDPTDSRELLRDLKVYLDNYLDNIVETDEEASSILMMLKYLDRHRGKTLKQVKSRSSWSYLHKVLILTVGGYYRTLQIENETYPSKYVEGLHIMIQILRGYGDTEFQKKIKINRLIYWYECHRHLRIAQVIKIAKSITFHSYELSYMNGMDTIWSVTCDYIADALPTFLQHFDVPLESIEKPLVPNN